MLPVGIFFFLLCNLCKKKQTTNRLKKSKYICWLTPMSAHDTVNIKKHSSYAKASHRPANVLRERSQPSSSAICDWTPKLRAKLIWWPTISCTDVFKAMFPGSDLVQMFPWGRDKTACNGKVICSWMFRHVTGSNVVLQGTVHGATSCSGSTQEPLRKFPDNITLLALHTRGRTDY